MSHTNKTYMTTTTNNNEAETSVLKPEQLKASLCTITEPRKKKGSSRITSYMQHDNVAMYVETPWLSAPFGLSDYQPEGTNRKEWSLNLSAGMNADDSINNWFEEWNGIDNLMTEHGVQHSKIIFGKEHRREIIAELQKRIVKNENPQYPPRIQPKVLKSRDPADPTNVLEDVPNVAVFTEGSTEPVEISSFDQLSKLIPKGGQVKAIVQPKIWYVGGKFGASLNLIQILVRKRKGGKPTSYAFSDQSNVEQHNDNQTSSENYQQDSDSEGEGNSGSPNSVEENEFVVDEEGGEVEE